MSKKTALYQKHLDAGAKLIDFGGWEMPVHYGSQLNEHHQVRQDAGIFDVSHMTIVDLVGENIKPFLRFLLANNIDKLKQTGKALYTCMLNEQGGIIDDLIVYYQSNTQFRMVVNAATHDKDLAWIQQQNTNFNVQITERTDLSMLAVQGPQAREKVKSLLPEALQTSAMALKPFNACWQADVFIARTGYTGEDGFEIMLPHEQVSDYWDKLLAAGVKPIGLGARDSLRLEAGMNLYGTDMDETKTPLESGLTWTVAWQPDERNFIGRQALENQKSTRHPVFHGLVLLDKGVLRGHQKVYVENFGEGEITSGSFSPTLNAAIGFSRLPAGDYQQVEVEIRNKRLRAKVVKLPFVRNGQVCVDLNIL